MQEPDTPLGKTTQSTGSSSAGVSLRQGFTLRSGSSGGLTLTFRDGVDTPKRMRLGSPGNMLSLQIGSTGKDPLSVLDPNDPTDGGSPDVWRAHSLCSWPPKLHKGEEKSPFSAYVDTLTPLVPTNPISSSHTKPLPASGDSLGLRSKPLELSAETPCEVSASNSEASRSRVPPSAVTDAFLGSCSGSSDALLSNRSSYISRVDDTREQQFCARASQVTFMIESAAEEMHKEGSVLHRLQTPGGASIGTPATESRFMHGMNGMIANAFDGEMGGLLADVQFDQGHYEASKIESSEKLRPTQTPIEKMSKPSSQLCSMFDNEPLNTVITTADARGHAAPPLVRTKSRQGKLKRCNCKNSKCLKLYCDCFSASVFCDGCNCNGCLNNKENDQERQNARQSVLQRNPKAFASKFVDGSSPTRAEATTRHARGCNCKNSKCMKNYCECFQMNVACNNKCKCTGCENGNGNCGQGADAAEAALVQVEALPKHLEAETQSLFYGDPTEYTDVVEGDESEFATKALCFSTLPPEDKPGAYQPTEAPPSELVGAQTGALSRGASGLATAPTALLSSV